MIDKKCSQNHVLKILIKSSYHKFDIDPYLNNFGITKEISKFIFNLFTTLIISVIKHQIL